MRYLAWLVAVFMVFAVAVSARAAIVSTRINRIAASDNGSVQLFLVDRIPPGACTLDYKVSIQTGTDLANIVMSLGTAALLAKKRVEIGYDNTTCVADAPRLQWIKVFDE